MLQVSSPVPNPVLILLLLLHSFGLSPHAHSTRFPEFPETRNKTGVEISDKSQTHQMRLEHEEH